MGTNGAGNAFHLAAAKTTNGPILKHGLRKAREHSGDALNNRIDDIIRATSDKECTYYITNAGHGSVWSHTTPMNRMIKQATFNRYHYYVYNQLHQHLTDIVNANKLVLRHKALKKLTSYEFICKYWTNQIE
jgi:hypothetical protein